MRNILLTVILLFTFQACNTYKKAQKYIYAGNFDQALDNMIKKYTKDNIKEKDIARWASTFNAAYQKANAQNIDEIAKANYLPEGSDKHRYILNQYILLQTRYDKLKPILPIKIGNENIAIVHYNYNHELENSRLNLANALFYEAEILIKNNEKMAFRLAYEKYAEVAQLIPNYTHITDKMAYAYERGLTHFYVTINNDSRAMLPENLYKDLTYFDAQNHQFFWQKFHTTPINAESYYTLELNFRNIAVSPELVDKRQREYQREWIDSSELVRNNRGEILKDSAGRAIKNYVRKTTKCKVIEIVQSKNAAIQSEFVVLDRNQQVVSRIAPVESNFQFSNISYKIFGDESAIDRDYLKKIKCNNFKPFPSNEQMVYDCGQDLKNKFSQFIASNIQDK